MEKYRTLAPRFCAMVLDIILLLPLAIGDELIKNAEVSPDVKWALYFTNSLVQTIYFIVMHGIFGQTVGKMLMKVKVLDAAAEAPIKFRQAILRDLPQLLITVGSFVLLYPSTLNDLNPESPDYWQNPFIILIFIWGFTDTLSTLTNNKRRALHDYIAGTVVVRTNQNPEPR